MILYICRHAWAEGLHSSQAASDRERPLTSRGRRRYASVIEKLVERDFAPGLIATSPLVRCRQTAELIAQGVPGRPETMQLDALAPGAYLDELIRWTGQQAYPQVAWVGHMPDVAGMTAALSRDRSGSIFFAQGSIAALRFEESPQLGQGELMWLLSAEDLGC